jgi:hypothetical protein
MPNFVIGDNAAFVGDAWIGEHTIIDVSLYEWRQLMAIPFVPKKLFASSGVKNNSISSTVGGCPGMVVLPFQTLSNLTESPTGTFPVTNNTLDANGKNTTDSLAASTNGQFQVDMDFTVSTNQTVICWDVSNSLATHYYQTARYVTFVSTNYFYNDNQVGAVDTGILAITGDILGLVRTGTNTIAARYYRSGAWTTLFTFTGTQTGQLFYYISSAALGATQKILNPKKCVGG